MAETEAEQATGEFETRKDAGAGGPGLVKLWLRAIDLAEKDERDWRETADAAVERLRDEKARRAASYQILYANISTVVPALYNSTPIPDVRRRFQDKDPVGKVAAQMLQRSLAYAIDDYDFDHTVHSAVHNSELVGRGLTRVRYKPLMDPESDDLLHEEAVCEHVDWRDFRHGPGRRWSEVMWVAFRHRLTREEARKWFGGIADKVNLDWVQKDADKDVGKQEVPDIFKRMTVWEVWDKDKRQVVFIAPAYKDGPLKIVDDPLGLKQFFPNPRPLYAIPDPDSLIPQVPYEKYRHQADELDVITRRIRALVRCLRWRGVRAAELGEIDRLKDLEDGDFVASEDIMGLLDKGGIEAGIWMMPIDNLITVIAELVKQREVVKQTVFEITGVADIMRGETDPDETLGAQRIKAQWGSLRVQERQREVQRYARDLLRLKAEIMAEKFAPETLLTISDTKLPTQQQKMLMQAQAAQGQRVPEEAQEFMSQPSAEEVFALLQSDAMRSFRVDIETDSTIQADLGQARENMSAFVEGMGSFVKNIGPAVQSGFMQPDVATDLLTGFARNFKLGRQAEDALDRMGEQAQALADQGPRPDPEAERLQAEMEMKQREQQAQLQIKQAELQLKQAEAQANLAMEREKMEQDMVLQRERAQAEIQAKREQADMELQAKRDRDEKEMELQSIIARRKQRDETAERRAGMKGEDGQPMSLPRSAGDADDFAGEFSDAFQEAMAQLLDLLQANQQLLIANSAKLNEVAELQAAPRELIRDANGRATGVRVATTETIQ